MLRRGVVIVCALACIGCSSDTSPHPSGSSRSAPTTTTTTAPTTTTTTVLLTPAASPQEATTAFVNAWRAGDRDAALAIALPTAVDAVFSAGAPGSLQNRGCNRPPADTPVLCVYKTDVGELQLRAQPGTDGWIVDQAILSAA
jgi:hypothetical protein